MEIINGIPDFQVEFDTVFAYFKQARKLIAEDEANTKTREFSTAPTTENSEGNCVCFNRKSHFSVQNSETYKRLLSTISSEADSTSPEKLPEFKQFQELHCLLKAAQQKAVEELQTCSPCGHLVLPIDVEEFFIQHILSQQLSRMPEGIYKPLSSYKFAIGRASSAKLAHVRSFGEVSALGRFSLNQLILPRSINLGSLPMEENIEPSCTGIANEADIIASADVLVRVLRYLSSKSRCFFPVDVVPSPSDNEKRIVLLHKPFLAEPLKDNRLRAQECYTELCKQTFVEFSQSVSNRPLAEIASYSEEEQQEEGESALTIDSTIRPFAEEEYYSHSKPSPNDLRAILERCHVVEAIEKFNEVEVLQDPASPELSRSSNSLSPPSPPSPSPLIPSNHSVATRIAPENNRLWNLFQLGHLNLLVSSSGLQLFPESCAHTTDCHFWPKCSELWSNTSTVKVVHSEVKPEYLQPWGCEELTEEEIFSSCLGAQLSCPESPKILRLRVEASTGRVILAEIQTMKQLLQSNPKFRFETHLAHLMNVLSPLTHLSTGKYLLSFCTAFSKAKPQLYELSSDAKTSNLSAASTIDLHRCAIEAFQNAGLTLTSTFHLNSKLGATWRLVKRLRLDLSIPSGVNGDSLLIPAIDTGFPNIANPPSTSTSPSTCITPAVRRSPRKRTLPISPPDTVPKSKTVTGSPNKAVQKKAPRMRRPPRVKK